MCDVPGNAGCEYDLVFFYQDQNFLKGVNDTPLPSGTSVDLVWKGDVLAVKVGKTGERVGDLDARDIDNIDGALVW